MFGLPFQQTALWNTTWQWQYMRWKRKKMRKDFLSSWAVVRFKQQVQSGNLTSQWKSPYSIIAMIGNTSTNAEFCMATLDYQRVVIIFSDTSRNLLLSNRILFYPRLRIFLGWKKYEKILPSILSEPLNCLECHRFFRVIPKSQTFCCNPRVENSCLHISHRPPCFPNMSWCLGEGYPKTLQTQGVWMSRDYWRWLREHKLRHWTRTSPLNCNQNLKLIVNVRGHTFEMLNP